MVKALVSDITPHFSQKPVLYFSCSDHCIFDYIYLNILGLFRLLNKEHRMRLWYKQLRKIVLTYQVHRKTKRYPASPALNLIKKPLPRDVISARQIGARRSTYSRQMANTISYPRTSGYEIF
jgi:hypothetical protein